jgi:hypothetical protein
MYQNINEILMNHGNKSTPSKSPAKVMINSNSKRADKEGLEQFQSPLSHGHGLNSNSSTNEFKKYLEELKKNYMEKLTYSCPSKLTDSSVTQSKKQKTNENKLQSTENISNLAKKVDLLNNSTYERKQANESMGINNENVRRSLAFGLNSKPTIEKNAVEAIPTAVNPTFSEPVKYLIQISFLLLDNDLTFLLLKLAGAK